MVNVTQRHDAGNAVATILKDPRKLFKGAKIGVVLCLV
jgi:hypothetical protein